MPPTDTPFDNPRADNTRANDKHTTDKPFHPNAASQISAANRLGSFVSALPMLIGYAALAWVSYSHMPRWAEETVMLLLLAGIAWDAYQSNRPRAAWAVAGVFLLVAGMYPFHSTDVFGYVNRGWQQVAYHTNPYGVTISQLTGNGWADPLAQDPMLTNHWVENPSPYGPLFLLIAKLACWVGLGLKPLTVVAFKGMNLLTLMGCAHLARQPWLLSCPLLLLHHGVNAHNDILVGFCMLMAATVGPAWAILPWVTAGGLIKYAPLAVLPITLVYVGRTAGRRAVFIGLLVSVGLTLLVAWPYWLDGSPIQWSRIQENAGLSHNSIQALLTSSLKAITGLTKDSAEIQRVAAGLKQLFWGGYLGFTGWQVWRALRAPEFNKAAWQHAVVLNLTVLILGVSAKYYAWYLGMCLPMGLILPDRSRLKQLLVLCALVQLFSLTALGQAHIINTLVMTVFPMVWVLTRSAETLPWFLQGLAPSANYPSDQQGNSDAIAR
jgi:hypothetical protein